jgi:hypothetical protein
MANAGVDPSTTPIGVDNIDASQADALMNNRDTHAQENSDLKHDVSNS